MSFIYDGIYCILLLNFKVYGNNFYRIIRSWTQSRCKTFDFIVMITRYAQSWTFSHIVKHEVTLKDFEYFVDSQTSCLPHCMIADADGRTEGHTLL